MPALGRGGFSVGRPAVLVGAPGGERRQVVFLGAGVKVVCSDLLPLDKEAKFKVQSEIQSALITNPQ